MVRCDFDTGDPALREQPGQGLTARRSRVADDRMLVEQNAELTRRRSVLVDAGGFDAGELSPLATESLDFLAGRTGRFYEGVVEILNRARAAGRRRDGGRQPRDRRRLDPRLPLPRRLPPVEPGNSGP
jgi:hypothetical protein